MACLHLVSFGFLVEFSNSPTLGLLCEMIVVVIENIKLIRFTTALKSLDSFGTSLA